MAQAPPTGTPTSRPRRRDHRPPARRPRARRRQRLVRGSAVAALAGVLLVWPAPVLVPGIACGPVAGDTAVVTAGSLADDGELDALEQRIVGGDGEVCVTEAAGVPTVAVGILHADAEGRSREAAELSRVEGRLTTRIEARDVTAATRDVTVFGPLGAGTVQRRVGMPQLVRIAVTYPSSWDVEATEGEGVTTTVVDGVIEVSRTAVLFPPLLEGALRLGVHATPGRGTPSVQVEATPLAAVDPFVLPDGVLEQDALAVIGALGEVGEDGATQLAGGADELAEGLGEVAGGAGELATGAGALAGGVAGLAGGAGELAGGAGEVAGGAAELADGTRQLAGGVTETARGSGALATGAAELSAGTRELSGAAGQLAQGAGELAQGADALAEGLTLGDGQGVPELDVDALTGGLEELAATIAGVRDDLAAIIPPDAEPTDPVVIAVATLTALAEATELLALELRAGLEALGAALEGLEEAAAGAAGLAEGARELAAGGAALAVGIEELAAGATELAAGTAELTAGLDELAGASGALSSGASGLATGTAGLAEGTAELAAGGRELATGSDELAAGTEELAGGTTALAEGSDELAEGARELPEVLAEVAGVADRGGQDAATTLAVLDAGSELAREHVGEAALRTLQLRHDGEDPVSFAALAGTLASVLVVLLGVLGLVRRRWGRG